MCGKTRHNRIRERVEVAHITEKMLETRLRCFGGWTCREKASKFCSN